MPKLKVTTLYNKNHIKIEKREYDYNPGKRKSLDSDPIYNYITCRDIKNSSNYYQKNFYKNRTKYNSDKEKTIIVRKKSPLGFYYDCKKTIYPENIVVEQSENNSYVIREYTFFIGSTNYKLTYYISYNGQYANKEMHPWELADNNSMPDHYVTALINELNKLFEICVEYKCSLIKDGYKHYFGDIQSEPTIVSAAKVKKDIFTDLFSFPDGPKYQTDMDKLLAHGFDPKMGFRNRPKK